MLNFQKANRALARFMEQELSRETMPTQKQLGMRLNMSQGTVSRILLSADSSEMPKLNTLNQIANYRGMKLWELIKEMEEDHVLQLTPNDLKSQAIGGIVKLEDAVLLHEILSILASQLVLRDNSNRH